MSTHPEQREQWKTEELEAIERQLAYAEQAAALLGQIRESIKACCGAVQTQLDTARKIYDEAEGRIKRVTDLEALALDAGGNDLKPLRQKTEELIKRIQDDDNCCRRIALDLTGYVEKMGGVINRGKKYQPDRLPKDW